jgi:CTP:molybdopterin cytidylyltransferase MocA
VDVDDPGCIADIDTMQDLDQARQILLSRSVS